MANSAFSQSTIATPVSASNGGTGISNNDLSTITVSGNFGTTLTVSGATSVTLPTSGTLATRAGSETLTNKTITSSSNVLGGVTMTLGSDADGDTYYRASGVLTRLPKGTALQSLRMNAGATAPEWATPSTGFSNVYFGTTSFTSTTTTTITCGFLPKFVQIFATGANPTSGGHQESMGSSDGSTNTCVYVTGTGAGSSSAENTNAWVVGVGTATTSNQSGIVNNITSTTFDLVNTYTNSGNAVTARIQYIAFG